MSDLMQKPFRIISPSGVIDVMLAEVQVSTKSSLPYLILIFILLQVWAIMSYEVAQYQMVILYEAPQSWLIWSSLLLSTLIPILGVSTWRLKETAKILSPNWNYRVREVDVDEFQHMIKEYRRKYRYFISSFDYISLFLAILLFLGILFLPFFLMRTNSFVMGLTPTIIALMVLIFGIVLCKAVFAITRTSATSEFPIYNPREYAKITRYFSSLPGIYWSGIRLSIGEAAGFFTIRSPQPVARIEGIESVGWLECTLNSQGCFQSLSALLATDTDRKPTVIDTISNYGNALEAVHAIKKTIEQYLEKSGETEILQEVLEEVTDFIRSHTSSTQTAQRNDGLISSQDNKSSKEEAD